MDTIPGEDCMGCKDWLVDIVCEGWDKIRHKLQSVHLYSF